MKLCPPLAPTPEPQPLTKEARAQLIWEREKLLTEAKKGYKLCWRLIPSKGTASMEYQEAFIAQNKMVDRIYDIDNLLEGGAV